MKPLLKLIKTLVVVGWVAAMVLANGAGWWWIAVVAVGLLGVGASVLLPTRALVAWFYKGVNEAHEIDCGCAACAARALHEDRFDHIVCFETGTHLKVYAPNWDTTVVDVEGGKGAILMWAEHDDCGRDFMRVLHPPFALHLSRRVLFVGHDEWFVLPHNKQEVDGEQECCSV